MNLPFTLLYVCKPVMSHSQSGKLHQFCTNYSFCSVIMTYTTDSFFHFFQVGTVITNAVINARKSVDNTSAEEVENVPILSTSVGYGVYMAISSNLRFVVFIFNFSL